MIYIVLFFCGILVGCDNSIVSDCKDYNIYLRMEQADGVSTNTPLLLNIEVKIGKVVGIEQMANGDILFKAKIDCREKLPINSSVFLDWNSSLQMEKVFHFDVKQHNQPYFMADDTILVTNLTR